MRYFMAAVAAFALVLVAWPDRAHACGGFFCSGAIPMDQSGENIVFAVEPDGTLETHVQILYSGEAERFAWILPVPTLPDLALGTDSLFVGLNGATAPRFDLQARTEGRCRRYPDCHYAPSCFPPPPFPGVQDASSPPTADAGSGVTVHFQETIGAFDAVVLTATDATTLHTWLADHEYDLPDASIPLLQAYVDVGDFFVALRLESGRTTGEIQPIVLRYREEEPCIPIRLTAIATVPDMPITAYVLGSAFATPRNYSFIEQIEDSRLWLGTASYASLVTQAANEAGGRAFATDYAGDPPTLSLALPSIDDLRTVTTPYELVQGLVRRGFMGDSQLLAVLQRVIPPPPGSDPQSYYNCLAGGGFCSGDEISYIAPGWDASAAVDVIDETILTPRANADALLARYPRLTRFFTTMSADEMTVDPVFQLDEGMAAVPQSRTATLVTECTPEHFENDAPQRIELPSGRTERVRPGHVDTRTDEEVCNASGGTLGPSPDPMCPPGSPGARDAGARMDGGRSMDGSPTGAPDLHVSGGGLCSAAPHARTGGASGLVTAWTLATVLAARAWRRRRRPPV